MADHQKIHPVLIHDDTEPPQTPIVPLVPSGTIKSDSKHYPTTVLPVESTNYPPFQRTIPAYHSKPPKTRNCLCKCLCLSICLLILLVITMGIVCGILYLVFKPKLPNYSIDRLKITQFSLSNNRTLQATFNVKITATNPNKKIGISYEGGSHISVWYTDTKLCEGDLPKFYQGYGNISVLDLDLMGQTENANDLIMKIQEQQQQTGNIPLNVNVNQPVRIKVGRLKLMKVKFFVKCGVVVDSVSANNEITIQSSSCKFKFRV